VSRPPLLTRELTSFEKAFYLYQKRLNERLALPFTRYFYYKKGTPAGEEWKRKRADRKSAARDIGLYSGYGDEAWNDEVLVDDRTAEPQSQVEALIRDAEGKGIVEAKSVRDAETSGEQVSGDETEGEGARKELSQQQQMAIERPMPRVTEADEKNDLRSLNRKLDRVLYLLVKRKDGSWRFPQDRVYGRENLHQVCRILAA
jgi:large subunit ribosomal protein L46